VYADICIHINICHSRYYPSKEKKKKKKKKKSEKRISFFSSWSRW